MFSNSVIEINKDALNNNLNFLRKLFGRKVKFSSVVKGNAYGHSIEVFTPLAEDCGIDHFSVFSASEALRVKNAVSKKPVIMIMGLIDNEELVWAVENGIEFFVFEKDRLDTALSVSKKIKIPARIHIEIETGLNRTGFKKEELKHVVNKIKKNPEHLIVEGLCTHYAGAESVANFLRIQNQIRIFNDTYNWFVQQGINPEKKHTACSAAAITYPETRMDLVRIGILQYGYWPTKETFIQFLSNKKIKKDPLKMVITWKSRVMSTKVIKAGEFIGYGTSYLAHKKMKIAVVPVGYASGFSRSLSNTGRVLINGNRVGVVGLVNMSLMVVDVSDIPEVNKGDEVVIIGKQGDKTISVSSFAEFSDQLNYELLTRLPRNIPRVIS